MKKVSLPIDTVSVRGGGIQLLSESIKACCDVNMATREHAILYTPDLGLQKLHVSIKQCIRGGQDSH